jgi:hypothetical protein
MMDKFAEKIVKDLAYAKFSCDGTFVMIALPNNLRVRFQLSGEKARELADRLDMFASAVRKLAAPLAQSGAVKKVLTDNSVTEGVPLSTRLEHQVREPVSVEPAKVEPPKVEPPKTDSVAKTPDNAPKPVAAPVAPKAEAPARPDSSAKPSAPVQSGAGQKAPIRPDNSVRAKLK